jgi:hypothetical protein
MRNDSLCVFVASARRWPSWRTTQNSMEGCGCTRGARARRVSNRTTVRTTPRTRSGNAPGQQARTRYALMPFFPPFLLKTLRSFSPIGRVSLQRVFLAACKELEASTASTYDMADFVFKGSLEVGIHIRLLASHESQHGFLFSGGREGAGADGRVQATGPSRGRSVTTNFSLHHGPRLTLTSVHATCVFQKSQTRCPRNEHLFQ